VDQEFNIAALDRLKLRIQALRAKTRFFLSSSLEAEVLSAAGE